MNNNNGDRQYDTGVNKKWIFEWVADKVHTGRSSLGEYAFIIFGDLSRVSLKT